MTKMSPMGVVYSVPFAEGHATIGEGVTSLEVVAVVLPWVVKLDEAEVLTVEDCFELCD